VDKEADYYIWYECIMCGAKSNDKTFHIAFCPKRRNHAPNCKCYQGYGCDGEYFDKDLRDPRCVD
jgi:hypothetical protein